MKIIFSIALSISFNCLNAQELDSIAFHLYTDSLKKGVHNYINVDGHLREGRWIPLSAKEISLSSSSGRFEGTSLIIDPAFKGEKVTITARHNRNNKLSATTTIYIKTILDNELLPTTAELMKQPETQKKNRRKKKGNQ